MEALVGIMLQERPGDAVVGRVVQQNALPRLVWCRAGAQGAAAAETERELQVPAGVNGDKRSRSKSGYDAKLYYYICSSRIMIKVFGKQKSHGCHGHMMDLTVRHLER